MHISIIGKPGSKAISKIVRTTPLTRYSSRCELIVNYGLAGERLQNFKGNHPGYHKKLIMNAKVGLTKYKGVMIASELGIQVPKTFLNLPKGAKPANFLLKRMHSQGGVGIKVAKSFDKPLNTYYQEFITNRRYELRVHGFMWEDPKKWVIQKRLGREGEITWNFHNGGRFQTIHNTNLDIFNAAKKATEQILNAMGMSFGAADFIVTNDNQLLFLEMNSAPGFTEFSEQIYINAFTNLSNLDKIKIRKYC